MKLFLQLVKKNINKIVIAIMVFCTLWVLVASYDLDTTRKSASSYKLDHDWTLTQENGSVENDVQLPYKFNSNTTGEYSFVTKIPNNTFETQLLTFSVFFKDVWVYVDGKLIYEHVSTQVTPGTGNVRIVLPTDSDGKLLEIKYYSHPCAEDTYFNSPTLLDATSNIFSLSINDILFLFIMFSFLFVSILLIVFYFFNYSSTSSKISYLYLALFFVSTATWGLCYTRLIELWIKDWSYAFNLEYVSFYAIVMSVWLLYSKMNENKSFTATSMKYLSVIFYFVTLLSNVVIKIPFTIFLPTYHLLALITICLLPFHIIINFKKQPLPFKLFSFGIACFFFVGAIGLFEHYFSPGRVNIGFTYLSFIAIAGLFFIVSVAVLTLDKINNHFQYAITMNQAGEYSRYETLFCETGHTFFDWNVDKDYAYIASNFNEYFESTIDKYQFLSSFTKAIPFLNENNNLMNTVNKVLSGSTHERIDGFFETKSNEIKYFSLDLTSSYDSKGNKTHVFGLINDSTKSIKLENKYNKQMQYININRQLYDNILEADIENDILIGEQALILANGLKLGENASYSDCIKVISEKMTHPDYAESYRELFSKERLLSLWSDGIDQFKAETYELGDTGKYEWLQLNVILYKSNETDSICIISYVQNITKNKMKELELVESSTKDSLSQLLNKGASKLFITQVLEFSNRDNDSHALLIIDIDEFKSVNDTLGHAMGDQVIVDVSRKIKSLFRDDDIVGRFGGDEFVVLIKNIKSIDFLREKCRELNREVNITYDNEIKHKQISLSIGLACYPQHGTDYDTLCQNADKAMYNSKRNGRNTFTIYTED